MRKNKGFTLIELLVVVAILAVVAALIVPVIYRVIHGPPPGTAPVQQQFTPAPFTPDPSSGPGISLDPNARFNNAQDQRINDLERKVKDLELVVEQLKKQVNR